MFNSTMFDVVFGILSLFLAISLATSALTEAVSTAVGLRAQTLLSGIKQLLNDPNLDDLALSLYNHALVNPFSDGKTGEAGGATTPTVKPSYIESKQFALALIDTLQQRAAQQQPAQQQQPPQQQQPAQQQAAGSGIPLPPEIAVIADPQIKATLAALYQKAKGDPDAFRFQVASWFDGAMDRLSGVYKRQIKLISFVVALAVAVILNADPIRMADTLWRHPELAVQFSKFGLPADVNSLPADSKSMALLQQIEAIEKTDPSLIGWSGFADDDPRLSNGGIALMVLGWFIAASAALFGAPFWFDVLQRFVKLRGTGSPPKTT